MNKTVISIIAMVIVLVFRVDCGYAAALTAGATYTIEVDAIGSNGAVVDLTHATTAIADSNGKLSFTFTEIPTRDSYNFLLITIKDSENVTVRRSIVPAPATGGTIDLGVSPMTDTQTEAMLSAMSTAGTDDAIMVLFGSIIIRSGGFSSEDITHLANIGRLAITGPNGDDTESGFNYYLQSKIGAVKMALFRAAIVSRMGSYTANLKQAVDAADAGGAKNERAEAAALLSRILIEAAAEAEFNVGYINAAMKAASDRVEVYLLTDGLTMNESAVSAMDAVMMSNYMKLNAERNRKKYTTAVVTLGASSDQVARLNAAITILSNAMIAAFKDFEEVFSDEEGTLDYDAIETAQGEVNTAMDTAFSQFVANSAATNAEIDAMTVAMSTGFDIPLEELTDMKDPNGDSIYTDGIFAFRDMNENQYNWPITMVVPITWIATNHGNGFAYTRDTIDVPKAAGWIQGQTRTDFVASYGMPAGMAAIMGLREDIEIIIARKWGGLAAASQDMTTAGYDMLSAFPDDKDTADGQIAEGTLTLIDTEDGAAADDIEGVALDSFEIIEDLNPWLTGSECEGIEDLALTRLLARKDDISSTTTTITDAQKGALISTSTMPDFH